MKTFLGRIRPTVLVICLMLTGICIADIFSNGQADIGLAAAGALAAIARDVIDRSD